MDVKNLIESFSEFKEMKNIDRETMMNVLEEVFRSVMAKQYGTDENIDVIINVDKGDLELWYQKKISFYTDFMIIFLTIWVVLFPKSSLVFKVFKDLPKKPDYLNS